MYRSAASFIVLYPLWLHLQAATATAAAPTTTSSSALSAAPSVCMNSEESSGACRDSHEPLSHVWPAPVLSQTGPLGSAPSVTLTNASLRFVATGGGPTLQRAVGRYHTQVFSPVVAASAPARPLAEGGAINVATLAITVRDAEPSPLVATEADESYELRVTADGGGTLRANSTVGAIRGLETYLLRPMRVASLPLCLSVSFCLSVSYICILLSRYAQLVEYSEAGEAELWALPLTIVDRPRWRYRGIKVGHC